MSQVVRAAVGRTAPFFKSMAWCSPSQSFKEVSLDDYKNKWLLLFFYPLNFTFVCPTEIIDFSNKTKQFKEVGCEVLGCSVDSHFSHMAWTKKARNEGGIGDIEYPLIADNSHKISEAYGVLNPNGVALRGTFIIDNTQVLKHMSINDLGVGRNVDEYIRLVKAFQFNQKHGEVCPSSWKPGDRAMTPDIKSEKLKSYWNEVHAKK